MRLLCWIGFHKYRLFKATGMWDYHECSRCRDRDAKLRFFGPYQPLNLRWLNGEDWSE